jgi:hypothetical protein
MSFDSEQTRKGSGVPLSQKEGGSVEKFEGTRRRPTDFNMEKLSATFENPLANIPKEQLLSDVETFCKQHNLQEYMDEFKRGALVAQSPSEAYALHELSSDDKVALEREQTHRWSQPWKLYWLASEYAFARPKIPKTDTKPSYVLPGSRRAGNG